MTAVVDRVSESGPPASRRTPDRRLMALVAVLPVLVSIGLAAAGGAWGTSRTDDWAFARVAFDLHQSGHVHLLGWSQMTLVGLAVWAQPWLRVFGDHLWVLDLSVAVLVGAGLAAAYRAARSLLAPTVAAVAVGSVVVFPGFLRDVSSFMTDGPAFAIQAMVLAAGLAAHRSVGRRRLALFGLVLALGFWGFTIREFAIAAPLAVFAAEYLSEPRRRRAAVAAAGGLLAACAAFYLWRKGLPGAQPLNGRPTLARAAVILSQATCTVGLGLAPVLAYTARSWWRPVAARARVRGAAIGAVLVAVPFAYGGSGATVLSGDYLDPRGINGTKDLLGVRPMLLPGPLWGLLSLVAIASTIVVAALLVEWAATRTTSSHPRRVLALHVAAMAGCTAVAAVLNGQLFDRYMWPIMLSGAILILARYPRRDARFPLAIVGFVLLALAVTANSDAFDGAKWAAGQRAVSMGVAARSVDAGFEWAGAHATGQATPAGGYSNEGATSWWSHWFDHPATCVVVAASPISAPGYTLERTDSWNLLLVAVPERLYTYRSLSCGGG